MMVGPPTNNYLVVEGVRLAESARGARDAGIFRQLESGGEGKQYGGGSVNSSLRSTSSSSLLATITEDTEGSVLFPDAPENTDTQLWKRWWNSLDYRKTATKQAEGGRAERKAVVGGKTCSLSGTGSSRSSSSGSGGSECVGNQKKRGTHSSTWTHNTWPYRFYTSMVDTISLSSHGERSTKESETNSDADSELYGFHPPDGIIPNPIKTVPKFQRLSLFGAEDLPFGGTIMEGEANAGVDYSYLPVDNTNNRNSRRSLRPSIISNPRDQSGKALVLSNFFSPPVHMHGGLMHCFLCVCHHGQITM